MTSATPIPGSVADITVDWLNTVLPDDIGTVASMRWEDLGEGVGILGEVSRVHLSYAEGQDGPASIIAKCASSAPENVFLCQAMGFYDREISFYRHAASSMPVRTPRCLHADMAEGSVPFVLLLEEIADVTVMDQIVGAGVDETASVFSMLARVHAHFWGDDTLDAHPWLPPMNNDMYKGSAALAADRIGAFRARWDGVLDADTLDAVEAFIPRYAGLPRLGRRRGGPHHGPHRQPLRELPVHPRRRGDHDRLPVRHPVLGCVGCRELAGRVDDRRRPPCPRDRHWSSAITAS